MRSEFVGRTAVRFQRVLARHFYVSAERQGADAVIGFAFAETGQPLAKPDGKYVYSDSKKLGGGVMAELVNQDHDSQHNGYPADVTHCRDCNRFHIPRLLHNYLCLPAGWGVTPTAISPTRCRVRRRASASR